MRTRYLFALTLLSSVSGAAANPSVQAVLGEASACSDAALKEFASQSCESPETAAERAVARCRAKWNSVTDAAMGSSPDVPSKESAKARKAYSEAMEYEYVRIAELKAIDIRKAAALCETE